MRAFLGIDAGTSSVKAALIREDGALLGTAGGKYETRFASGNRAEQDPEDWWNATADTIKTLLEKAKRKLDGCEIAGISISSQTPSLVALDADMKPIRPAMIWMDRRATAEKEYIERVVGLENYKRILGATPDAYYLLPKLLWYKWNEPENYAKTKKVLMTNSYLNFRLAGVCATDILQAITTQCMDIASLQYSRELEQTLDLPLTEWLPAICPSTDVVGMVTPTAAARTGLPVGVPVCAGTSDTMGAIFGLGILHPGMMGDMTGTSSLVCFANGTALENEGGEFLARPSPLPQVAGYLVGTINATGGAVEWFRKSILAPKEGVPDLKAIDQLAEKAEAGCGGLLFFPYLAGERTPLWNSYAKGMYIGLTMHTGREELARAVLEGTAFALRHVVDRAKRAGAAPREFICGGGGANSDIWLRIKASMLGVPLKVAEENSDAATRGNALIAGIGTGAITDVSGAVRRFVKIKKTVEPDPDWARAYDALYPYYLNMYTALAPQLEALEGTVAGLKEEN